MSLSQDCTFSGVLLFFFFKKADGRIADLFLLFLEVSDVGGGSCGEDEDGLFKDLVTACKKSLTSLESIVQ